MSGKFRVALASLALCITVFGGTPAQAVTTTIAKGVVASNYPLSLYWAGPEFVPYAQGGCVGQKPDGYLAGYVNLKPYAGRYIKVTVTSIELQASAFTGMDIFAISSCAPAAPAIGLGAASIGKPLTFKATFAYMGICGTDRLNANFHYTVQAV